MLSAPSAAQAYTALDEPELVLLIDPDDIVIGSTAVPFESRDFLPGSVARFSVSAPGVSGGDITLEVTASGAGAGATASGSIAAVPASDATFTVEAVFPMAAVYTIATEGLDLDGNTKTVSMRLALGQGAGGGGSGSGSGGGSGLPNTGFTGADALITGTALVGLGAGVVLLSRRRTARESAGSNV